MKYKKAQVEIVRFQEKEFMTGSGNFDGGYCNKYTNLGITCGYVTHCDHYSTLITCNDWFECDSFGPFGWDMGFLCVGFA